MKRFASVIFFTSYVIVFSTTIKGASTPNSELHNMNKQQEKTKTEKYTNHLIDENSPYLLSHAHNPVNWYPWGEEAIEKARREDKPIFLSIGYSACHWCHVMERESFENEQIATILNANFVSIKVDREQRPDLDQIYMSFTTAMTGRGGWPMSVFLTPDLKPFFAGTYFPPDDRYGRPGFSSLITQISTAYKQDKSGIVQSSEKIFKQVQQRSSASFAGTVLNEDIIKRSVGNLMGNYDDLYGGFGQAPKFPHATELALFLRYFKNSGEMKYLQAVEKALQAMSNGGIYDHLGGGFARYSTDRKWLVPHFEKMLYDNALLVPVYADAYQITGNELYAKVIRETLDFMLREMRDKSGGFYSALDADSEGEEGKFYVWSKDEIEAILGAKRSEIFCRYYNVTKQGNFEEKNILNIEKNSAYVEQELGEKDFEAFLASCRSDLMKVRDTRVRPLTDDKILTSWNGFALTALCRGYQVTLDERYLQAAIDNAEFVRTVLVQNGSLTHSYREGSRSEGEFLEDYAFYIRGLIELSETDYTDAHKWREMAISLARRASKLFFDENGTQYLRPAGESDLIVRPKDETDGAIPSPGSYMIANLFLLNRLTDDKVFLELGEKALGAISGQMDKYPGGMASAVSALDYYLNDKIEVVIVGDMQDRSDMLKEAYRSYSPNLLIAVSGTTNETLPLFEGRKAQNGKATAYVCRNSVCNLPVTTIEELRAQLIAQ